MDLARFPQEMGLILELRDSFEGSECCEMAKGFLDATQKMIAMRTALGPQLRVHEPTLMQVG